MAYLQQGAINNAVARLHYLGSRSGRRRSSGMGSMGHSVGQMTAGMAGNTAMPMTQTPDSGLTSDVHNWAQAQRIKQGISSELNPVQAAQQNMAVNSGAEQAAVNGQYADSSLPKIASEAEANGRDRLRMKSILEGLSGQGNSGLEGGVGNTYPGRFGADPMSFDGRF